MSAAPEAELLASLRGLGLHLATCGDGLINAGPRDRVTEQVRSRIHENKPALLRLLECELCDHANLVGRIRAMAERWRYTEEDLGWAIEASRLDPPGWITLCEFDEGMADRASRAGMRFPR